MRLHGLHFQVVAINGERFSGAVRDTVGVPHMAEVTIAFDADNPGKWPFHCHHLYHMASGMMGYVEYGNGCVGEGSGCGPQVGPLPIRS